MEEPWRILPCVAALLHFGVKVHTPNHGGMTALQESCLCNQVVFQFLMFKMNLQRVRRAWRWRGEGEVVPR